ncbi:unnamed protein product, partial [Sphacelaria rigidula]
MPSLHPRWEDEVLRSLQGDASSWVFKEPSILGAAADVPTPVPASNRVDHSRLTSTAVIVYEVIASAHAYRDGGNRGGDDDDDSDDGNDWDLHDADIAPGDSGDG